MKREYVYAAIALALGGLAAWWWKRSQPQGNVEVGPAGATKPYGDLPVAGEHEQVGGVDVVGVFGLDWS